MQEEQPNEVLRLPFTLAGRLPVRDIDYFRKILTHIHSGNCGGVIAAFLFLPKHAPRYVPGLSTLTALLTMSLVLSTCMTIYYRRENARRDRVGRQPSEYSSDEMEAEREKGDYATFFRYMV